MYPPDLYKGVFWTKNPNIMYLGTQDQYFTFNRFDCQAWLARDYMTGKFKLPSPEEMEEEINKWIETEKDVDDAYQGISFHKDYVIDLMKYTDYSFPADKVAEMLIQWYDEKKKDLLKYRDTSYFSAITGNEQPKPSTTWLEAMDDSMDLFVNRRKSVRVGHRGRSPSVFELDAK